MSEQCTIVVCSINQFLDQLLFAVVCILNLWKWKWEKKNQAYIKCIQLILCTQLVLVIDIGNSLKLWKKKSCQLKNCIRSFVSIVWLHCRLHTRFAYCLLSCHTFVRRGENFPHEIGRQRCEIYQTYAKYTHFQTAIAFLEPLHIPVVNCHWYFSWPLSFEKKNCLMRNIHR